MCSLCFLRANSFYCRTNAFIIFELKELFDREAAVEQRPALALCGDSDTTVNNITEKYGS